MPKYEIEVKKFSELQNKIEIPKFQRGLVWNKTKKKEFIKTLKAGLPIGVLLLSKKGDKYLIVDGLQRFTTMMEYAKDFFGYIEKSEITDVDLMSIVIASADARTVFDAYTPDAKQKEFERMREIIAEKVTNGQGKNPNIISTEAAQELCKKIAALPDKDIVSILNAVYLIVDKIFNQKMLPKSNINVASHAVICYNCKNKKGEIS